MKKDDLTLVKHIGAARMKLLNDVGITTIKQLHETPLEKLARIGTIGEHYAKLIKDDVSKSYGKSPEKAAPQPVAGKKKRHRGDQPQFTQTDQSFKKAIKTGE